ncbi:MAG: hypothetical protein IJB52_02450 [Clostridia bacterium]|nr:hypothetical protein [Clostridia bacterium]
MKRRISILLLLALCLSMTAGCGGETEETDAGEAGVPVETEPAETTEDTSAQVDELPADLDFGGATIGIASSVNVHFHGYMDVAEYDDTTSVLDQSIYNRNRNVEERLNVKITEITAASSDVTNTFKNTITAGDDSYQIFHGADRVVFNTGLEGYLLDVAKDMPYIDLEKEYWYADGNEVLNVGGKQLAVFGEMSLGTYDYCHLLAFNQDLIREYSLTSPWDYYTEDNWTFDSFGTLVTAVYDDLDGTGTMDENDRYGFHTRGGFQFPLMYTAAGLRTVEMNADGLPEFTAPANQKLSDVYDWCTSIFYDGNAWYKQSFGNNFLTESPMFQENKMLITDMTFFYVSAVRDMDSDFGIIVYPKYNAEQERYYTWVEGGAKAIGISLIAQNKEAVGAVLEAMGTDSLKNVIPTYYEINLKAKYSRDEMSSQMFDVIRESRSFDLGDTVWCETVREKLGSTFNSKQPLASSLASIQKAVDAKIASAMEVLAD